MGIVCVVLVGDNGQLRSCQYCRFRKIRCSHVYSEFAARAAAAESALTSFQCALTRSSCTGTR